MAVSTQGLSLAVQASLRIQSKNTLIHIDPFQVKGKQPADILLITHPHFDHFDLSSIQNVYRKGCTVCVPKGAEAVYTIAAREDVRLVKPGMGLEIKGVRIRTVPAYNVAPNRTHYHPKENEWVGYIIEADGRTIYHAGDTDHTREMKLLRGSIDVSFLPIGGTFTMDAKEASEAVADIEPLVACPMHAIPAGDGAAQKNAQEEFKRLVESQGKTKVEIVNGKGKFD